MIDFETLALSRQSDRGYDRTRPVEPEKLDKILRVAMTAPSACNAQPYKIIVVDEEKLINEVADCTSAKALGMNHFTKQAPVHLVIVEEPGNLTSSIGSVIKDKHFPWIDIGIVASYICLTAREEGLGTCILGWFQEERLKKVLGVPKNRRILLDITLGYSTQPLRAKKRKPFEKVVTKNKY